MFELTQIGIGWLFGIVTLLIGEYLARGRTRRKLARILWPEINSNYIFLKLLSSLAQRFDDEGDIKLDDGTLLSVAQMRWVRPFYLERTIFEATLMEQGELHHTLLVEMHKFYAACKQVERFMNASEDESKTLAQRRGFLKDMVNTSISAVDTVEKEQLLARFEKEGTYFHKLRS